MIKHNSLPEVGLEQGEAQDQASQEQRLTPERPTEIQVRIATSLRPVRAAHGTGWAVRQR